MSQNCHRQILSRNYNPSPQKVNNVARSHLQGTEVCFQAMSNQYGVSADKAQQCLLDLSKGGVVTLHLFLTDARKSITVVVKYLLIYR